MSIGIWIYVLVFHSIALVNLSVLMSVPWGIYYYSSVVQSEIRESDTSGSAIIVQDCFTYPDFVVVVFQMKLSIVFSRSVKNFFWNFDGDCLHGTTLCILHICDRCWLGVLCEILTLGPGLCLTLLSTLRTFSSYCLALSSLNIWICVLSYWILLCLIGLLFLGDLLISGGSQSSWQE